MQISSPFLLPQNQPNSNHTSYTFTNRNLQGRFFSSCIENLKFFSSKIGRIVHKIFFILKLIFDNPNVVADLFEKIHRHIIPTLHYFKILESLNLKLQEALESTFTIINSIQIAADIDYFVNTKFDKNNPLSISARIALLMAHLGQSVEWLAKISLLNLEKIAANIAKVQLFSWVPKLLSRLPLFRNFQFLQHLAENIGSVRVFSLTRLIKLDLFIGGAFAVSYGFYSLEAFNLLRQTENGAQKKHLRLELLRNLAELSLTLMLMTHINIPTIGAISCMYIGLKIASVINKNKLL